MNKSAASMNSRCGGLHVTVLPMDNVQECNGLKHGRQPSSSKLRKTIRIAGVLFFLFLNCNLASQAYGQQKSIEQRQPLELVFADSIVPQDRHEAMFTTGVWYSRRAPTHDAMLTQKVEWGISDQLQVSTFIQTVNTSNVLGSTKTGMGDFEIGARYTWSTVGSEFTHIAVAVDAGFPTGNPRRGLGEGAYTISPSVLLSRELLRGTYQLFSTTGFEFVVASRRLDPLSES
jgi:hypothetical protein